MVRSVFEKRGIAEPKNLIPDHHNVCRNRRNCFLLRIDQMVTWDCLSSNGLTDTALTLNSPSPKGLPLDST